MVSGMGMMQRAAALFGFVERSANADTTGAGIKPPSRRAAFITSDTATHIADVYRAVELLQIGVSQLGIDQWRGSTRLDRVASIIQRPDVAEHRFAFIEYAIASLALDGNAYWRLIRDAAGQPLSVKPLNPRDVTPYFTEKGERRYSWRGQVWYPADRLTGDIIHLQKLRKLGSAGGLGVIEAAAAELTGAMQARDYSAGWFDQGDVPSGILSSDQVLTGDTAKQAKRIWKGLDPVSGERDADAGDGFGVRVLGQGLTYTPIQLKPADLQFLETLEANTTKIARMFGVPASLMLAVVEGNSQTYSNVEQDWIAFTRFTLMKYIREIEEAFEVLLPHGNSVRFNVDALHRSDRLARYQAHAVGITGEFLHPDEAREIEGLDPLTDKQRADFAATRKTPAAITPQEPTNV